MDCDLITDSDCIKTADYNLKNFPDVYEPSEDSFLFLDALEKELGFIKSLNPLNIIEIGSGSGVIVTSLAKKLDFCNFFTTDINFAACEATLNTACLNLVEHKIQPLCMDLLSCFKNNSFDVVIFNPPYVVTSSDELSGKGLNRAWAGGLKGREIVDKLLPVVWDLLSEKGVFYLLLLKENQPREVVGILCGFGFKFSYVVEKKILGEYLYIIKFYK